MSKTILNTLLGALLLVGGGLAGFAHYNDVKLSIPTVYEKGEYFYGFFMCDSRETANRVFQLARKPETPIGNTRVEGLLKKCHVFNRSVPLRVGAVLAVATDRDGDDMSLVQLMTVNGDMMIHKPDGTIITRYSIAWHANKITVEEDAP